MSDPDKVGTPLFTRSLTLPLSLWFPIRNSTHY